MGMSTIVNMHEAKTHLSQLVAQAENGQDFKKYFFLVSKYWNYTNNNFTNYYLCNPI